MPGQINWVELPATDTARARTFYGGLFGWGTNEFGGDHPVKTASPTRGSTSPPTTSTPPSSASTNSVAAARTSRPCPASGGSRTATTTKAPPFSLYEPAPQD
jgi:hypothetical protein